MHALEDEESLEKDAAEEQEEEESTVMLYSDGDEKLFSLIDNNDYIVREILNYRTEFGLILWNSIAF